MLWLLLLVCGENVRFFFLITWYVVSARLSKAIVPCTLPPLYVIFGRGSPSAAVWSIPHPRGRHEPSDRRGGVRPELGRSSRGPAETPSRVL